MNQKITGFHQDAEKHWVAELGCGHAQHVRHDPPWMERPWVTTEEGRQGRIGVELNCVRCDELGNRVAKAVIAECRKTLSGAYESAGISGLCDEGRWEVALGSLESIEIEKILESVLKATE